MEKEKAKDKEGLFLDRENPFAGMVKIQAGTFQMGKPSWCKNDEWYKKFTATLHAVTISRDFWIARYPMTKRFYAEVLGKEWKPEDAEKPEHFFPPLAWQKRVQELDVLKRLNEIFAGMLPEGYHFCIPTEAQWEYAARAGSTSLLPKPLDGLSMEEQERISEEYFQRVFHTGVNRKINGIPNVTEFPVNAWGLYGMPGGVNEFCLDLYDDYPEGPVVDPEGPMGKTGVERGVFRVVRGYDCATRLHEHALLYPNALSTIRLVITPITPPRVGKTEYELQEERKQENYKRQLREAFEDIYPEKDISPLMQEHYCGDDEFNEYMLFTEWLRKENIPFKKAEYCCQEGLELLSSSCAAFCFNLAVNAAPEWDEKHGGKQ